MLFDIYVDGATYTVTNYEHAAELFHSLTGTQKLLYGNRIEMVAGMTGEESAAAVALIERRRKDLL
jgi:hypothetical protein